MKVVKMAASMVMTMAAWKDAKMVVKMAASLVMTMAAWRVAKKVV